MQQAQLNWITNYIWGIADDVLRDVYVRGKYRDVILPMTVLRRLDSVLEPTKQAVLDMKQRLDAAGITNQDAALRGAAQQHFYNTSAFTMRDLRARTNQQQLRADFEAYLNHTMGTIFEDLVRKKARSRSATTFRLHTTSTSRSRCVRLTRSAPTYGVGARDERAVEPTSW
jgi:type I restriction-modification system DNA methylase subunit